jgi:hypothetical protein
MAWSIYKDSLKDSLPSSWVLKCLWWYPTNTTFARITYHGKPTNEILTAVWTSPLDMHIMGANNYFYPVKGLWNLDILQGYILSSLPNLAPRLSSPHEDTQVPSYAHSYFGSWWFIIMLDGPRWNSINQILALPWNLNARLKWTQ